MVSLLKFPATQKVAVGHEMDPRYPPGLGPGSINVLCDKISVPMLPLLESTVSVRTWVPKNPNESVAPTVKVSLAANGSTVPVISPVKGSRLRPVGREPEAMLQVMAPVPPEDSRV
jgi:hypothetical protein